MNYINFFFYLFWFMMMMMILLKHPLVMGMILILNSMTVCILISMMSFSSWNAYILFLMFLGGVLILFLYNISLISTDIFSIFFKKEIALLIMLFLFTTLNFNFKETYFNDSINFFLQKFFLSPTIFFFSGYNFNSILFLVTYLFITLICVVNLIYLMKDKGTIRM